MNDPPHYGELPTHKDLKLMGSKWTVLSKKQPQDIRYWLWNKFESIPSFEIAWQPPSKMSREKITQQSNYIRPTPNEQLHKKLTGLSLNNNMTEFKKGSFWS